MFHLNLGIRHRSAVEFNNSLEQIPGIQAVWFNQGYNFGFKADLPIPAVVVAKCGYDGFGEVNDKAVFRRFPVWLGFHEKHVDTGPMNFVGGFPYFMVSVAGGLQRFKQVLGDRVTDVQASKRLSKSVARLVDPGGSLNPELQRVYKYLGRDFEVPKKILELNPSHIILKNLVSLDSDSNLQTMIIEQIYDSALLVEGLHPDPSSIVPRIQQLMEAVLSNSAK